MVILSGMNRGVPRRNEILEKLHKFLSLTLFVGIDRSRLKTASISLFAGPSAILLV